MKQKAFTLVEVLVAVTIIAVLAGIILIALNGSSKKARDVRREAELRQIGQFLTASSCYLPNAGPGDYDLATLVPELTLKYPQYAYLANSLPHDPKSGSSSQTNYHYIVTDESHCDVYANLENENEPITLTSLSSPTAGGGTGVLKSNSAGANGTDIYFQIGK